ncbi:MAG: DUF3038 domain-containing protein [Gomphosphaeria aponina SAG 52.96 = DSM 107014]|uniref:DUF3038 domain-containing protein n=1 Tax=Gomphosphaeria aponina SAG 52.96 = DSM 107014 TaxID=1521640 RepID=A0A941GRC3_9CHRO|nr:DUF3038 domain-containing protein [Gomphosphaeria aponina SAG 52.96 = DSM 107014]
MSHSATVMQDQSSPEESKPLVFEQLPDFPISGQRVAVKIQQKIDLMLLALEALELGGSEYMLATALTLQIKNIIKNRVILWRLRCSNPWRRSYSRDRLTLEQAKALVAIATFRASQLKVLIRQLLIAEHQMKEKGFPLESNFRLSEYLERFRAHFTSRMNPRRAKVAFYLAHESELNEFALSLLRELLFCGGIKGMERFWISLFDGEVE